MATFTAHQTLDVRTIPEGNGPDVFSNRSSTGFTLVAGNFTAQIAGTGFTFGSGDAITGTAERIALTLNGAPLLTISGMNHNWASNVYDTGLSFGGQVIKGLLAEASQWLAGNDTVLGSAGNDVLAGFGGNDSIDGGTGRDTALFYGLRAGFTVARATDGTLTVTDRSGTNGTDTLRQVERLQFNDQGIAFDTDGTGGMAYRLYQAAFNRQPDQGGLGFQIKTLDAGWNIAQVAANFIASPEFQATYGALNDAQFVTQLYANVLHRAPDAGGLAFHTGNLASGANTRANVLVGFSESQENQAALIGSIQNGMEYTL